MSAPVGVLAVMDECIRRAEENGNVERSDRLQAARAAVPELIEKGESMLPRNLCLDNTNVSDAVKIPLLATMGELRAFASALARVRGAA